jgi:hypothetical protein
MNLTSATLLPVMLAIASPALCQSAQSAAAPRAYVTGMAGTVFDVDFERPATAVAVEFGERVHRDVQAYALLSYVDNLMSERMRGNLALAGAELSQSTGVPWEFRGRDRGLAFTVGGKFLFPGQMAFRPYFGGGLGVLNVKRRIQERDLGDVSGSFFALTGRGDGIVGAGETAVTRPLAEVVLGASGPAGRAYLDIAYRYRRAFHAFDSLAFSQVTVGIGVAF